MFTNFFLSKREIVRNNSNDGYNVSLCNGLEQKHLCPFCKKLMRDPIQTYRGELACHSCYKKAKSADEICPIDKLPIKAEQIFEDRCRLLEIRNLPCYCGYKQYGCDWIGVVCYVEDHEEMCSWKPAKCFLCGDCIKSANLKEHLEICSEVENATTCIFTNLGCNYKPSTGADLLNHLENFATIHMSLLLKSYQMEIAENASFQAELVAQRKHAMETRTHQKTQIDSLKTQVSALLASMEVMESQTEKLMNKISETSYSAANLNVTIEEDIHITANDIQTLSNSVSALNTTISDIDLRQQLLENITNDGRIIWKIDNFKVRYQQAVSGRVTALHSAPGFTSKYGYKFCARLYLNGDGMGKGTHLSLFFVVMKSEYDNLLEWPFNHRVTFRLINQNDSSLSIKESFIPDRNSSSFQKPKKEMNVAAGCPMFIPKVDFFNGGYIRDESFFIEITTS